jgi:hypothetical protein
MKKKDYEIIGGGIEYTRPPYSKVERFLTRLFCMGGVLVVIWALSSLIMLFLYWIGGY